MGFLAAITGAGAIGDMLGGIGKLAKNIRQAITGEMSAEQKAEINQQLVELESSAALGQMKINEAEAKHPSIFVAGWRPFVGWVCGIAFLYHFIASPTIEWVGILLKFEITRPQIPLGDLLAILTGMLGFGYMRSKEKKLGVQNRH